MTLLIGILAALAGAASATALRRRPELATAAGVAGGVVALLFVLATRVGTILLVPGAGDGASPVLELTAFGRLLVLLLGASGLALSVGSAAGGLLRVPREVAAVPTVAAADVGIAGVALTVVAVDPPAAGWAVLAAGAGVLLLAMAGSRHDRPAEARDRLTTSLAALRIAVAVAAVAAIAIAWGARTLAADVPDAGLAGIAYLGFIGAVAVRSGAVPFHGWAARSADLAPVGIVAVGLAWLPAAWTVAALAWNDAAMTAVAADLGVARGLVLAVALATMALAALAAWIQDDLRHLSVYLVIAGAGVALLGLSAIDRAAWAPARTWLLVGALAGTGLLLVALALADRYGTRRLPELGGWGRRSPGLTVAVVCIAVAVVGIPGTPGWAARQDLVTAAVDGPLAWIARLLLLAPLAVLGRVLVVGLTAESPTVRLVAGWMPPSLDALRPGTSRAEADDGDDTEGHALDEPSDPDEREASSAAETPPASEALRAPRRRPSTRRVGAALATGGGRATAAAGAWNTRISTPAWTPRGSTLATAAALLVAVLALAVSLGGFDVAAAAAGGPPGGGPPAAEASGSPAPGASSSAAPASPAPGASSSPTPASPAPTSPAPGASSSPAAGTPTP